MPATNAPVLPTDECYRCGYDLRTIDNAQPCPECGLLAERSRHLTDELHNSRPRWLRNLSLGVWLILIALPLKLFLVYAIRWLAEAIFSAAGMPTMPEMLLMTLLQCLAEIVFLAGVFFLTSRENYPPADNADRRLRLFLRLAATLPLLAQLAWRACAAIVNTMLGPRALVNNGQFPALLDYLPFIYFTPMLLAALSLPFPLFERLRTLAKRARSAHLAEHCRIVGIGATASVLIITAIVTVLINGDRWFNEHWSDRSPAPILLGTALGTLAILFCLWSFYLLIRFALAFHHAARGSAAPGGSADHSLRAPDPIA